MTNKKEKRTSPEKLISEYDREGMDVEQLVNMAKTYADRMEDCQVKPLLLLLADALEAKDDLPW